MSTCEMLAFLYDASQFLTAVNLILQMLKLRQGLFQYLAQI